jgi:hypothetical protein
LAQIFRETRIGMLNLSKWHFNSTLLEILQALQWQNANEGPDHLVSALLLLITSSEYAGEFDDPQFDAVIHEEAANYTPTVKTMLYATAAKQFAPHSFGKIFTGCNAERVAPGYRTWVDEWPFTRQLRVAVQGGGLIWPFVIRGANQVWANANRILDMSGFDVIKRGLRVPIRPVVFHHIRGGRCGTL